MSKFYINEYAVVDTNVQIGESTKIWHFSHVQKGAKIGKSCVLGQNVNVGNNVSIGDYCKIQNNVSIYEGVTLEDYVFCGPSMVFTNILDPKCKYPQVGKEFYKKTLVKEGASIGANATIVCGVTLGEYSFVGAGSTVTKDTKPFSLNVGSPAKQIGWMSKHGERMDFEDNIYTCIVTNEKYVNKGDNVYIEPSS